MSGYCRSVTVAFIERVVVFPHLQHVNTFDSEYANNWRITVDCFVALLQRHTLINYTAREKKVARLLCGHSNTLHYRSIWPLTHKQRGLKRPKLVSAFA